MSKNLVIVESPSKSNTIKKILGSNYTIKASYGHIIDLPKTTLGIDIEKGYTPRYKVLKDKKNILEDLKKAAKKSDNIYLASDPDREGEAIAWHIANQLKMPKKIKRIAFNEITKTAVKKAIETPREIDQNLVDAQQTRRILDRIVGFKISPLLWTKISQNTSAGRVQSVSLKLICDLENEIKSFISEKYWNISILSKEDIELNLSKINNKKIDKLKDEKEVKNIKELLKDKKIDIENIEIKKKKQAPPLPFKTSTLQQLSSTYLNFSPSKTMTVAQQLYEGINVGKEHKGLITYMRTDSTRISKEASDLTQKYIAEKYGKEYCGKNRITGKKNIQDAHEAIRPTDITIEPDSIKNIATNDQYKLYKLIWERYLISQFAEMQYEQFKITAKKEKYEFVGTINKIIKEGYYKIYKDEDKLNIKEFPKYEKGDILNIKKLNIKEDETKPPARYTEASLVKKLEALGIGRPSTYASILETLKKKKYVELQEKKLIPTVLGYEVKDELEAHFKKIMNVNFTAELETDLDKIADGKDTMFHVIDQFYQSLSKDLEKYQKVLEKLKNRKILTDVKCKNNVDIMLFKTGRFGKYLVCETDEKETISIKNLLIDEKEIEKGMVHIKDKLTNIDLKKIQYTDMLTDLGAKYILKSGRFGFYLESENYEQDNNRITLNRAIQTKLKNNQIPYDDDILLIKPYLEKEINENKKILDEAGKCDKCGSDFAIKLGRFGKFLACSSYPECKNIKNIKKKK